MYKLRCLLVLINSFLFFNLFAQNCNYLIEAEDFQFKGKWFTEHTSVNSGGAVLRLKGGGKLVDEDDALTVINLPKANDYNVWVKAADFLVDQGSRFFYLSVNKKELKRSGTHGKNGFYWEMVGKAKFACGENLLRLHAPTANYSRCDAILLTTDDNFNPNKIEKKNINSYLLKPMSASTAKVGSMYMSNYAHLESDVEVLASIENSKIKLSFVQVKGYGIAIKTELKNKGLRNYATDIEDNKVFLIKSDDNSINYDKFYPSWNEINFKREFEFKGEIYNVSCEEDNLNPFMSGQLSEAIPVSVTKTSNNEIDVSYITKNNSSITGVWSLSGDSENINVNLICTPSESGMYSVGIEAFHPIQKNEVSNVLMPPMFQFKRIPDYPLALLSSMMTQPLAIVESEHFERGKISYFISCDNSIFSDKWGDSEFSPIGFSLRNHNNEIQPVAFSPVIGMKDSKFSKGQTFSRKFIIGLKNDGWDNLLEDISNNVFSVADYRQQNTTSLTDAYFNMIDLISREDYSGWDKQLKGFYDIESDPSVSTVVVQSAPLAIVSAAIVTNNENLYLNRALPTIEYTLSRSGFRWSKNIVPNGFNKTMNTLKLNPFESQYPTSYFEGLENITYKLNPWLVDIALPDGKVRETKGYSYQFLSWVQYLSAYKLTNDHKWRGKAISTARRYVNTSIYNSREESIRGNMGFYNSNIYPAWWNLIDIYEISKDTDFLEAACYGAASTIAGVRSFPKVENGMQTIHPNGEYEGNTTLWWKGKEKYRLGFPRKKGDLQEKKVPAWKVSPVGLGIEQPGTYFLRTKGKLDRPIFMNNWSPHLLRLYQYSHKLIYEVYSRNAIIGRFGNYPGYYATGYTDVTMSEDFPYKGPDVSSIYYHHIPAHLAFTYDFLVSEAIERSNGNVKFPYGNQEGFVWFSNRIYGGKGGKIFNDDDVRLWMRRDLVKIDRKDINYITALSKNNFWVLLSSESNNAEEVSLDFRTIADSLVKKEVKIYSDKGEIAQKNLIEDELKLSIPARGFRAVALPAKINLQANVRSLKKGMKIIETGTPFGKLFLFRIRSPFGWDSIYGFAETSPQKENKLAITVKCKGLKEIIAGYPFEFSYSRIEYAEDAILDIALTIDNTEVKHYNVVMNH